MINRMEMVNFLLKEIEDENKMFEEYKKAIKVAEEKSKKESKHSYWLYLNWVKRVPSKARIQNNIVKIRQLLLDESKEVDKLRGY